MRPGRCERRVTIAKHYLVRAAELKLGRFLKKLTAFGTPADWVDAARAAA